MVTGSPRRGEVYWVRFDPVVGAEMGKTRPAVIVQNDAGNAHSKTTIVATISSRLPDRPYPFLVALPEGTLPRPSVVNCAHLRTIDMGRVVSQCVGRLDRDTMRRVDAALVASLGVAVAT